MVSVIRIRTLLKYARLQLQEAEASLQEDNTEQAIERCKDVAASLIKVIGASLPHADNDFLTSDEPGLARALAELTYTPHEARPLAANLAALSQGWENAGPGPRRSAAEACLTRAGEAFRQVHDLCVG